MSRHAENANLHVEKHAGCMRNDYISVYLNDKLLIMENIVHLPDKNMFTLEADGHTAFVEYRIEGGELDILHTIVPKEIEGRGMASALVKAACDYALSEGLHPVASCVYAARWLERHPEYMKQG